MKSPNGFTIFNALELSTKDRPAGDLQGGHGDC
jgi:hypothetical protein